MDSVPRMDDEAEVACEELAALLHAASNPKLGGPRTYPRYLEITRTFMYNAKRGFVQ